MHDLTFRSKLNERLDKSAGPDACWLWTRCRDANGYGRLWNATQVVYVHRMAWEQEHGPIPAGLHVCHICDNPSCGNPAHLFLGTNTDNIADKVRKGRAHRLAGERHPKAKLTSDQVREIRSSYVPRVVTMRALSERYNVSQRCVQAVLYGENWRGDAA